jgi:TonB-dependent SusC/RagA subfamily outer membrane receptor
MNRKFVSQSSLVLVAVLMLGSVISFRYSDDPRIVRIIKQIETLTKRNNFQKVYLKTDKDKYLSGETIWMKAHLIDALNMLPDVNSNEIYVDLLGKNHTVYESVILQNKNGVATGDIFLTDSLPDGYYQIVAYSNWMKNFDEAFYFSKTIQIVNPNYGKYLTQSALSKIKQVNKDMLSAEKEKTVQFFPEGGTLVAGISCRVAFKSINKLGMGVNVKGDVFDNTDKKLTSFDSKHLGMGTFSFTPEPGKKYYAKAVFDDNTSKKLDLPLVEPKGYVLMANTLAGDQVRLNIQSNAGNAMDDLSHDFFVVGQARGEVRYISKVVYKGKPVNITIPKKHFPAGIAQITIFDNSGNAACERLIFIHPKEIARRTTIDVLKSNEGSDIVYTIRLKDTEGKPVAGNVALSVSENVDIRGYKIWNENIITNLLLTSDLKGKVENVTDYFSETNQEAAMNIDLVMMVNGWRRFVWKEILAGQFPVLLYAPSEGVKVNEASTTTLRPAQLNLSDKAYFFALTEEYDSKIIRKNTREAQKLNAATPSTPSNTIVIDPNSHSYSNIVEFMKGRVAGVTVMESGIRIRGVNSINAGLDPLILQDNIPIQFSSMKMISPKEVSTIEVLKGPDASLYGVRGANGVIIIHMRTAADDLNRASALLPDPLPERIISFHKEREFYVPVYDSWDFKPADFNVPRSVFWKANIAIDSTGQAVIRIKNRGDISSLKTSVEGLAADGSVLYNESVE